MYLGDFTPGATIRGIFTSKDPTGAASAASSGTIRVYKDGSTTESAAGASATLSYDAVSGLNLVVVDTSSDGTFYAAGSDFFVVATALTVNGVQVGPELLVHFSLANRRLEAVKAKTDTIPASPAAVGSAMTLSAAYDPAKTAATQASVDDLPTNGELATALGAAVTATASAVWAAGARTLTGFGTLVADMWSAVTRTLTAGTNIALAKGTGVTGFNDLSAEQVKAEADQALADYDAPTKAEMDIAFAAGDDAVLTALVLIANRLPSALSGSGRMLVDVRAINDAVLTGDGTSGTPWGPA